MFLLYGFARSLKALSSYLKSTSQDFMVYDDRKSALEEARSLGYNVTENPTSLNPDCLVITPAVRHDNFLVVWAKEKNISVTNDIDLFFKKTTSTANIGVTGTFGKSNCVWSIHQLWNSISDKKIQFGGNIGVPVFSLDLEQPAIIELSAQQLSFCNNLKMKIAMILNLFPQHLDFYSSLDEYYMAKLRIFDSAEICICNIADIDFIQKHIPEKRFVTISDQNISADYAFVDSVVYEKGAMVADYDSVISAISFVGAYACLRESGFSAEQILAQKVTSLAHRSEIILKNDKITVINDSKATNLMNSVYIIKKYAEQDVAVILGGKKTPQDLRVLDSVINDVALFITTGASGADLNEYIQSEGGKSIHVESLQDAIKAGSAHKILIFTPGYPSTDQYRDFEHRGEVFRELVLESIHL